MELSTFNQILLSGFFIFLNGFFVLAEFGIVKVRNTQLSNLIIQGNRNAKITQEIINKLDYYLNACQLGITIASIGLGWIGEPVIAKLIKPLFSSYFTETAIHIISFATAFAMISFLHIVVGELVPKSIAIRKPLVSALFSAPPLYFFAKIFFLPLFILNRSSNMLLRIIGIPPEMTYHIAYTEEEFREILSESQTQGTFSLNRLFLTENVLNFGKLTVANIMTPINRMAVLYADKPWEENLATIRKYKRSRYPLCQGNNLNILGFIHLKDIVISNTGIQTSDSLKKIARPVFYIKPGMLLDELLRIFQKRKTHMALVNSYDGKLSGFLTLEDIIEELTGEIQDEFTTEEFIHLANLITRESIVMDLDDIDKKEALKILAGAAVSIYPKINETELSNEIWKREAMISTAIGNEIAIPHARLEVTEPLMIFGKSRTGIDFNAPDKVPVKLIFLVVTPVSTPIMQLRILAKIARSMESSIFKQKLLEAKTANDVLKVIRLGDFSYPAEINSDKLP